MSIFVGKEKSHMYDIIGDVHGFATLLRKLLKGMGYAKSGNGYRHTERKAVFVGDFVNRGPEIRQTLQIIRAMVDNGDAFAILGNHEINTILYHLKNQKKEPLLLSTGRRVASVTKTMLEFRNFPLEWKEYRKWMRGLPLFLELEGIRVVHACWNDANIELIKAACQSGKLSKKILRDLVLDSSTPVSQSILQTTRGIHLVMPNDLQISDTRKRVHRFFRVRWWEKPDGLTFQEWSFESKFHFPHYTIPPEIIPEFEVYPEDAPPVFFGHYCRGNGPHVVRHNVCCVDACVNNRKTLGAYRWNGEQALKPENMLVIR